MLLDIEGTTTPITFVYDVLFPYARSHLRAYLHDGPDDEVAHVISLLRSEHALEAVATDLPPWPDASEDRDSAECYARWLMGRDRKSPALKLMQGLIWERGYADGALHGDVFDDVPPLLARARSSGVSCAIYSSGSVLAQRLLFSSTHFGDLTPLLSGFFDTGVGAKRSAASYREISRATGVSSESILFVSDVSAELDAAQESGCQVVLCVRPDNPPQPFVPDRLVIHRFDEMIW